MNDSYTQSVEAAMQSAGRLSSYSDDDLLNEIERRYPTAVILFLATSNERQSYMRARYHGGFWACLGMVQQQAHDMLKQEMSE